MDAIPKNYLEKRAVPAGVLLASVPVMGLTGMMMRSIKRYPKIALMMLLLFDGGYLVTAPEVVRDAFFSNGFPEAEFSRHFARVQTESYRMMFDVTVLHLPPSLDRKSALAAGKWDCLSDRSAKQADLVQHDSIEQG